MLLSRGNWIHFMLIQAATAKNSRVLFMFVNIAFGPLSLPVPYFAALKNAIMGVFRRCGKGGSRRVCKATLWTQNCHQLGQLAQQENTVGMRMPLAALTACAQPLQS